VSPIVHEAWDGQPITLPGDARQVLEPAVLPALAARAGHDIVTSDGTTLLGADDKAGIAEIMAAVAYLARTEDRPRASIRVAFTVDEEVGRGAEGFDLESFGADVAYTLDGSDLGELEVETFSAASVRVTIRGLSVHPGTAKDKLVNAVKLAAELVLSVPAGRLSPETTEGREGYVHPHRISGSTEEAVVDFIARDHDDELLASHVELLRGLAAEVEAREPRAKVDVEVRDSYRNMRPFIEENPRVVEAALEAIRRAGVEPRLAITRGGTDGAVLSAQGLPTPNLFTGGQEYHSVREWASVQDMAAAAATIVELAGVWAESTE
jgi:tripeptide aminopeptidase